MHRIRTAVAATTMFILLSACTSDRIDTAATDLVATQKLREATSNTLHSSSLVMHTSFSNNGESGEARIILHSNGRSESTETMKSGDHVNVTIIVVNDTAYSTAHQPSGKFAISGDSGKPLFDSALDPLPNLLQADVYEVNDKDEYKFRLFDEDLREVTASGSASVHEGKIVNFTYKGAGITRAEFSQFDSAPEVIEPSRDQISRSDRLCGVYGAPIKASDSDKCPD